MASTNCQNDVMLLSIAREVGRKVYTLGLDSDYNRHWYSPVERDAFMTGWLEAATESAGQGDFSANAQIPFTRSGRTDC